MSGKCVFKPGDYVVPIRADRNEYAPEMETVVGEVLKIPYGFSGNCGIVFLQAGKLNPRSIKWFWHRDDLRHATAEEIAAATKPKPLRRGDLVMWNGEIGVVHEIDPDGEDGYWVAMLTGDASCVCSSAEDLTRVGSIRKKIKRLKEQFVGDEK